MTPPARKVGATPRAGVKWFPLSLVVGVLAVATWVSSRSNPGKLPGFAMDSSLLFHIERGAFTLALVGTAVLVGYRATRGDFPLKFGPWLPDTSAALYTKYEEDLDVLRAALNRLQVQVRALNSG